MTKMPVMWLQRSFAFICIWSYLTKSLTATPLPQNPFEQAAIGALGVASQVAEIFQNGAALRKDVGFQLPGMAVHSKSEIGMGQAMIRRSESSEEDSDEDRRKRSVDSDELTAVGASTGPRTSFTQIMRRISAPCHSGSGAGTGGDTGAAGDGEDIIDEARRRIARQKARKAAAAKKAKKSNNSKSKNGRRRRQTEVDDLAALDESKRAELENEIKAHVQQFIEKINRVYENIASTVMDMMKRMEENLAADGSR